MITTNLFNEVLLKPVTLGANKLCIVSGYATSAMAFRHLETIKHQLGRPVKVELMVGMSPLDGISLTNHKGFQKLTTEDYAGRFQCSYIHAPPSVHSKAYVWLKDDEPFQAFAGSANYTQAAFGVQREILVPCDPVAGYEYYDSLTPETIYCDHNDAELLVQIYNDKEITRRKTAAAASEEAEIQQTAEMEAVVGLPRRCVSFLANDGTLPQTSGLNWGQREGREQNQAYIKLPASVYNTDFFPPVASHFTVLTDDNKVMICARAQQSGKAIHTPHNNSEIGIYFRQRLGVSLGDAVQLSDLETYGRTEVCFYKIDDETYFMDFSNGV